MSEGLRVLREEHHPDHREGWLARRPIFPLLERDPRTRGGSVFPRGKFFSGVSAGHAWLVKKWAGVEPSPPKKGSLLALCALLLSAPLLHARPLSVSDCVDYALGRSPAVEAGKWDLLSATAAIRAQRAALLPSLTAAVLGETLYGEQTTAFALKSTVEPDTGTQTTVTTPATSTS